MPVTILYPERLYPDDSVERSIYGDGVCILMRDSQALAELDPAECAEVDGLMLARHRISAEDFKRFPRLRSIVRMGVGYDSIDRVAAAAHNVLLCNVPDYGTTEVADHAMALALSLRRGVILHHDAQRRSEPAAWRMMTGPLVRRAGVQTFGIVGIGRIGTAVALRARAFNFRVVFFDPERPSGWELGLGISRARTLPELLEQSDVLSLHAPLTRATRGMIGAKELAALPEGAVLVNTARGPIVDIEAVTAALRSGHLAGAALDVLPQEPPADPLPELVRAYRAREPWLEGRLVITPHVAYYSPQAFDDTRRKSAETMRAALLTNAPQNVITPDME
jgi:phosphoglycerate dehydrogenase-like enzyme